MTTTAVILAAGEGTRLKSSQVDLPKPLTTVGGLPMIRRVMKTAQKAGITRFVVVIGYKGEYVEEVITRDPDLKVATTFVINKNWEEPNGVSLLCAEEAVGNNNFILLMSDHIFNPEIIIKTIEAPLPLEGAVLAIDQNISSIFDIDDATKVLTDNEQIIKLGKSINHYNAIDTGVFHCTPGIFRALKLASKSPSLTDGMQLLADKESLNYMDIGDLWWQDIDTPEMLRYGEALLYSSLTKPTDGIVSKLINRPISTAITKRLVWLRLTPDIVTLLSIIISVLTAYLFAKGTYANLIMAGLLFQFGSILDGCDGEMARLTFKETRHGAWLDTIGDNLSYMLFLLGISFGMYTHTNSKILLTIGILNTILLVAFFVISYTWLKDQKSPGSLVRFNSAITTLLRQDEHSFIGKILLKIQFMIKRDFFALATCIAALFNQLTLIFTVATISIHLIFWTVLVLKTRLFATPALSKEAA